jgi:hypothetical protein
MAHDKLHYFSNTSHLSYPESGSCGIQEPLLGTAFMSGNDEGRIVSRLVVMDRGGVRSPSSFLMTTARQGFACKPREG